MEVAVKMHPMLYLCLCLLLLPHPSHAVSHTRTLLWTQRFMTGAKIMGIPGDPNVWVPSGASYITGHARPLNPLSKSHRVALTYHYDSQQLFWSDRGYKTISKIGLKSYDSSSPYTYNATVHPVFTGISTQVNGIAVDWIGMNLFWTDAHYNWISVVKFYTGVKKHGNSIYRFLITSGLDRPMGIAVYPQKGWMFLSDWGSKPKIERASLDGTNRRSIVTKDLDHPLGIAIDYDKERLFWVDNRRETISSIDLDGIGKRTSFSARSVHASALHSFFGISLYGKHLLFATDQGQGSLMVYNRTRGTILTRYVLGATPYDVTMYDGHHQTTTSGVCFKKACHHLCLMTGVNTARCMCRQGFRLKADGKTCEDDGKHMKPQYIYTIGHSICGTLINFPDRSSNTAHDDIHCFKRIKGDADALGFNVHTDLLFYADNKRKELQRLTLDTNKEERSITVQTGDVRGIAVDWVSDNLYWTDSKYRHIMVSRTDGRYHHILHTDTYAPNGIDVDPKRGTMYWCDDTAIHVTNMDATSQRQHIGNLGKPHGLIIDHVKQRMFWTDVKTNSLWMADLNGGNKKVLRQENDLKNVMMDVTVYQDYVAWTKLDQSVHYGLIERDNSYYLRGIRHLYGQSNHDIITYDYYMQPKMKGPCDINNGGCMHLCLPIRGGHSCRCAIGFRLAPDGSTCLSEPIYDGFLIFVDPYQKQIYQTQFDKYTITPDNNPLDGGIQGLHMDMPDFPISMDYDPKYGNVYWLDGRSHMIKTMSLTGKNPRMVVNLANDDDANYLTVDVKGRRLLYSSKKQRAIVSYNMQGTGRRILIKGKSRIGPIVIHHKTRMLYWTETDGMNNIIKMISLQRNGTVKTIWTHPFSLYITSITIDESAKRILWCQGNEIFHASLDGGESGLFMSKRNTKFQSVAAADKYIYYTEWNSKQVVRVDKTRLKDGPMNVTHPIFARIYDLKAFSNLQTLYGLPVTGAGTGPGTGINTYMLAAIIGGILFLLLLAGIIFLAMRLRRNKTPEREVNNEAHDNPVYMMSQGGEPLYETLGPWPAANGAAGVTLPLPLKKVPIDFEEAGAGGGVSYDDDIPIKKEYQPEMNFCELGIDNPALDMHDETHLPKKEFPPPDYAFSNGESEGMVFPSPPAYDNLEQAGARPMQQTPPDQPIYSNLQSTDGDIRGTEHRPRPAGGPSAMYIPEISHPEPRGFQPASHARASQFNDPKTTNRQQTSES